MRRAKLGRRLFRLTWTATLLLVGGCSDRGGQSNTASEQQDSSKTTSQVGLPTPSQQAQMVAAKDVLFEKLLARLMEVMASEGPVAAIDICKREASEIAQSIGQQQGVKIGRTALKLRNPQNTPPTWAQPLVDAGRDEPTFLTLDDGRGAALLPIKLKAFCLMCHGPPELIMPEIKSELATHYPQDKATGFREGDLRGWFWVETLE